MGKGKRFVKSGNPQKMGGSTEGQACWGKGKGSGSKDSLKRVVDRRGGGLAGGHVSGNARECAWMRDGGLVRELRDRRMSSVLVTLWRLGWFWGREARWGRLSVAGEEGKGRKHGAAGRVVPGPGGCQTQLDACLGKDRYRYFPSRIHSSGIFHRPFLVSSVGENTVLLTPYQSHDEHPEHPGIWQMRLVVTARRPRQYDGEAIGSSSHGDRGASHRAHVALRQGCRTAGPRMSSLDDEEEDGVKRH